MPPRPSSRSRRWLPRVMPGAKRPRSASSTSPRANRGHTHAEGRPAVRRRTAAWCVTGRADYIAAHWEVGHWAARTSIPRRRNQARSLEKHQKEAASALIPVNQVRVDRLSLPPSLGVGELEDREMQMRRVRRRVAGRADVADDLALGDLLAVGKPLRVPLQVRVVVAELAAGIELVD